MSTHTSPKPPIPQQDELLNIGSEVVLAEYHQVFKNQNAHLPEVALRYLIWLIVSDSTPEDIKVFANQMRLELNNQRLHRIKDANAERINKNAH